MDPVLNRERDPFAPGDNKSHAVKIPVIKILFLSPDPRNAPRLRLGNELQEIRNRLEGNVNFEIRDRQAVKPNDVIQSIIEYEPNIVHFSGHGLESGELCFEDEQGYAAPVPKEALSLLFKLAKDHVKCVIVNTCYSDDQANAIAEYIPVVIGTKKEIGDKAAIGFSTGFYTALNPDLSLNSIQRAFELGKVAIQFGGSLQDEIAPILIFGIPNLRFSAEVETAISHISSINTPDVAILKKVFKLKGKKMGLDPISVDNIIEEKLQKVIEYNNRITEYEKTLSGTLSEAFPLSDKTKKALQALKNELELREEDTILVEQKILKDSKLDTAEAWYDRGAKQLGLENYEDALINFLKACEKYPEYSGAHYQTGFTYSKMKRYAEAVAEYTKAIEINNKWEASDELISTYFERGYVQFYHESSTPEEKREHMQKALEDWTKTTELSPKEAVAYFNRGLVNDFFNRFSDACQDYENALKYNYAANNIDQRAILLRKIAKAYQNLGDTKKAEEFYTQAENLTKKVEMPPEGNSTVNDNGSVNFNGNTKKDPGTVGGDTSNDEEQDEIDSKKKAFLKDNQEVPKAV